jgi:hypothetical protein
MNHVRHLQGFDNIARQNTVQDVPLAPQIFMFFFKEPNIGPSIHLKKDQQFQLLNFVFRL